MGQLKGVAMDAELIWCFVLGGALSFLLGAGFGAAIVGTWVTDRDKAVNNWRREAEMNKQNTLHQEKQAAILAERIAAAKKALG